MLHIAVHGPKPDAGYSRDAELRKVLVDTRGNGDEAEPALLDAPAIEKLNMKNARLKNNAAKAFPESPWYLAILLAALVGVFAGLLYLSR